MCDRWSFVCVHGFIDNMSALAGNAFCNKIRFVYLFDDYCSNLFDRFFRFDLGITAALYSKKSKQKFLSYYGKRWNVFSAERTKKLSNFDMCTMPLSKWQIKTKRICNWIRFLITAKLNLLQLFMTMREGNPLE